MSKIRTEPEQIQASEQRGRALMEWDFPEFEKPQRTVAWYLIAGVLGIALLFFALRDGNFLFALIILLFAFIIFTHHRTDPLNIRFVLHERGIQIGDSFYPFRDLRHFAIIYDPPVVKRLYIVPKKAILRREISIPLGEQNPLEVRAILLDYVDEDVDREEESEGDRMARLFKL